MKKHLLFTTILVVFLASFITLGQSFQLDPNLQQPKGMVNDFANIIDDTAELQIEQKLRDFKAKTNPQVEIAVVTIKTTGDRPIFDYSLAIARNWKIGSKEDDNPSALLLIAVDDRKYFTQVSKDLEDELTDGIVGQLQRAFLVPAFKQSNYTKGINDTVDAYIRTIEQRKSAPTADSNTEKSTKKDSTVGSGALICGCLIIVAIIIFFIIISSMFGRGGKGGGGGSGSGQDRWRSGGFGGNTSNSGYSAPIIIWGGGGGSSSDSDWGSSGGGDSWGGFGGGGDFGGGGAGGDW
ncbi:MAG: TPM domain-containing protein [Pyrinomonadaceae bacterium]|jgi:uncharacterized protein|nr:TPM domain-containing protein [Pyrinomonadaceae bacterium]